jgi:molecular chaperone DnaJ
LRGKGLPQLQGSGRGDMIIRVSVWTPTELTPKQEELMRRLAEIESAVPEPRGRDGDRSFWSKVREALGG